MRLGFHFGAVLVPLAALQSDLLPSQLLVPPIPRGVDFDADTVADLALGLFAFDLEGPSEGCVLVLSGASGIEIARWHTPEGTSAWGQGLCALQGWSQGASPALAVVYCEVRDGGAHFRASLDWVSILDAKREPFLTDLDASMRGVQLLALGEAPTSLVVAEGNGRLRLFRPATGSLWDVDIEQSDAFRAALCELDDLDGDGQADLAVGNARMVMPGSVKLVSSANGEVIATLDPSAYQARSVHAGESFGWDVASGFDLDGDGTDDLLVGNPGGDAQGVVHLISGSTREELGCLFPNGERSFGWCVAVGPAALPEPIAVSARGSVSFFSACAELGAKLELEKAFSACASTVRSVPDLDGDGLSDWMVFCDGEFAGCAGGLARVYSSMSCERILDLAPRLR